MLGACLAGYFVYHAVQGDRGIVAWMQLNQQIRVADTELAKTDGEREEMEPGSRCFPTAASISTCSRNGRA